MMRQTNYEFRNLDKWAAQVGVTIDQAIRAIIMQINEAVILRTPVDTGRARGNWQASISNPASGVIDVAADAGSGANAPAESNASRAALAAANPVVERAAGEIYYLTNNLPYIRKLEYGGYGVGPKTARGFSRQAPKGMIRITMQELQTGLPKVIRKATKKQ